MPDECLGEFWSWFQREVLPGLALDEVPGDAVIEELDTRMHELGVAWALGPAPVGSGDWAVAVSFGADLERLSEAEVVARAAPRMRRCQVFLGKPRKLWNGVLELPSGHQRVSKSGPWGDVLDGDAWREIEEAGLTRST